MTTSKALELMQRWLQQWMQKEVKDLPNFTWIEENLDAYNLIVKALYNYDNPEDYS